MTTQKNVRWRCPECGNYHSWYWDIYDVFAGEITMTCDNPECGAHCKMMMVIDKNGNGTAIVRESYKEDKELEDKLRRATEKVMNSQIEIDPSRILKDNDCIWYMGEKYQKIETPQSFYDKLWGLLKTKLGDTVDCDEMSDRVRDLIREHIPEPYKGMGLPEYSVGFNECIRRIEENLK